MDKDYYKSYFELERNHWWFLARNKIIIAQAKNCINKISSPEILNVGAGTGRTSELLNSLGEVKSLEPDPYCVNILRDELKMDVVQGTATSLPYEDNSFDLVCALDVIEHIKDDAAAVRELFRVCRPGGYLLLTVPALMSLWSNHDVINHHFRRYNRKQLLELFSENVSGMICFLSYFNFFLFLPAFMTRMLSKTKKDDKQSDFEKFNNPILNKILYFIFHFENLFLRFDIRLPIGSSLLLKLKKPIESVALDVVTEEVMRSVPGDVT